MSPTVDVERKPDTRTINSSRPMKCGRNMALEIKDSTLKIDSIKKVSTLVGIQRRVPTFVGVLCVAFMLIFNNTAAILKRAVKLDRSGMICQ